MGTLEATFDAVLDFLRDLFALIAEFVAALNGAGGE